MKTLSARTPTKNPKLNSLNKRKLPALNGKAKRAPQLNVNGVASAARFVESALISNARARDGNFEMFLKETAAPLKLINEALKANKKTQITAQQLKKIFEEEARKN